MCSHLAKSGRGKGAKVNYYQICTKLATGWEEVCNFMKTFFSVLLPTVFLELNLSQLFPLVFIPSRRVGSWMTASFHLDEDACGSVINILLTFDLVCCSIEGSADGEQGGMAAMCKSFALVIRSLTYCRFCCYSLSMTFNGEFTGTVFDLQSELRAKMKKLVIPFAIEVTIFLLDLFQHWELLVIFARDSNSWGHSPVCTVQFTCASALNIYISVFCHANTPFGIPVSLLSSVPTTRIHNWKDNCLAISCLLSPRFQIQAWTSPLKGFLEVLPWFCSLWEMGSKLMSHFTASVLLSWERAFLPEMIHFFLRPSSS